MGEPTGFIEVDLFADDVDDPDHPDAIRFREILEIVAEEYECSLTSFDVHEGTAIFSFDSHELTANILKVLKDDDSCEC
ncbi:MAG: hypothetical protein JRK53_11680 [Deltaproteobacteria bacterium]|nr:hypothetical protein [Deltaproteobacteria bacterium]MBW2284756.1 hypothetical protein [Deltaproteobacteria bacterium]